MNWVVIKFSGKQFLVKVGAKIRVDNLPQDVGERVVFDQVLISANKNIAIGKPLVTNSKVEGKIIRKFSGSKLIVTKFKPKSRYLRRTGARAKLAEIEITRIGS